jgi:methylmalonyl-CoA mutase cobalamin-binding domain/chain
MKILLARHVFEGHDIGARMIAIECRNQGIEVVLIRFLKAEEVIKSAQEEDVFLIGLTSSSGTHLFLIDELMKSMKEYKMEIPIVIGGIIPKEDESRLLEMGVKEVFGPGSSRQQIVKNILKYSQAPYLESSRII